MHILYGSKGSGSSIAEAALERCGLPYRLVRASEWEPDSARDELKQVNPLGQIPTLVLPDGGVLTESAAILLHLGLAHPDSGLLPEDGGRRAQTLRGLVFIAANCYSAISQSDYPERYTTDTGEAARAAVRQAARALLHRHWEIFADTFGPLAGVGEGGDAASAGGAGFLGGERPGALDLMAAVVSKWSGTRAHLQARRPGFLALLQRIEAHPDLQPVFARHWG